MGMLRKITSDTWRKSAKEIFIDRNGERFQYVLDYMRDNEVVLPLSVSRDHLITDMKYFGIAHSRKNITSSPSVTDPKTLLKVFHQSHQNYRDYIKTSSDKI